MTILNAKVKLKRVSSLKDKNRSYNEGELLCI